MGAVAKATLDHGGKTIGIVPEPLFKHGSKQLSETIIVPDMHTRKKRMAEESDAFVVLPGGFGTMEEMLEMITWSQLNIHSKPIILLNTKSYFKLFVDWVNMCVIENFIQPKNANIFVVCDTTKEFIHALQTYEAPKSRYEFDWTNKERDSLV
ncbi:cytokinin riboside 5'-monophosphate phosphoribohydrolase LOG [Gilbertella persicaria]|nr:cytokinin riboside 5'-monophosphate phosphoribohydrolase LOG [Gilbertella persicaria]KAI8070550.1 cytokinin riboside 5'-monophosphate phosphoribohydrolase LOG [Gilbertella persicaria]